MATDGLWVYIVSYTVDIWPFPSIKFPLTLTKENWIQFIKMGGNLYIQRKCFLTQQGMIKEMEFPAKPNLTLSN